jgi:CDP-diglyceride synthetase
MHPMIIVGVVLHVTLFATLAFFVLFAAQRAQGLVKLLGNVVGAWLLLLAILVILACATAPMFGGRPFGMSMGEHMSGHADFRRMHRDCDVTATPSASPAQPDASGTAPNR